LFRKGAEDEDEEEEEEEGRGMAEGVAESLKKSLFFPPFSPKIFFEKRMEHGGLGREDGS
jgi:hypothetical protein